MKPALTPVPLSASLPTQQHNSVRAAYTHHVRYLKERHQMMQWWADYLDEMKATGKVVPCFQE